MTINNKIEVSGLHKSFGTKKVLDGVDLSVAEGQSLVVIGGSGSGKSVLIKNIIGLIQPDAGSIKIDGDEVVGISEAERFQQMRKFGMLFQGGALFDSMKVWQNIAFFKLYVEHAKPAIARNLALEKLADVGLSKEVADLYPSELSGGMQKRVALARAIAVNPEIIFFDEPTTGLDPIMSDVINDLIVKCAKKQGITTLSITHDMASARKIADRIAMIYKGKIIWQGTVSEMDSSDNPYLRQFISGSAEGPIQMDVRRG